MKTQIIALASHDDLISVRDRMSWGKSPRILLVWPAFDRVPLRALDLRVLQRHALTLGAQMGIVTRRGSVRREAEAFGIPVFDSTAGAQRDDWGAKPSAFRRPRRRRSGARRDLRSMRARARPVQHAALEPAALRVGVFGLAAAAVLSLASIFVPRAEVVLTPVTMNQTATIPLEMQGGQAARILTGGVRTEIRQISVSGNQSMGIVSVASVPSTKAKGTVHFANATRAAVVIPAGTVVYSIGSGSARFATLAEVTLAGGSAGAADVGVEALDAGEIGNVPANAIQGVEGPISSAAIVTNPAATSGGQERQETVASQADREQLRSTLVSALTTQAKQGLEGELANEAVIVPETLKLASVEEELFDPAPGQPGSVLSLSMRATFEAVTVGKADLARLAGIALDAQTPPDYQAKVGTLGFTMQSAATSGEDGGEKLNLEAGRQLMRRIDLARVEQQVRGQTPGNARRLIEATLPLAAPVEIRVSPNWWPWLPLIPFRIQITLQ